MKTKPSVPAAKLSMNCVIIEDPFPPFMARRQGMAAQYRDSIGYA